MLILLLVDQLYQQFTTQGNCVAVGYRALRDTTGASNTAVGSQALQNNTSGDGSVAIGKGCLVSCTTGRINVNVGADGMSSLTSGQYNTGIGYETGNQITDGSNNVLLGFYAGRSQGNLNNKLFIARDSVAAGNAQVWIYGDQNGACFQGNNSSSWSTTSDQRLKKDIVDNNVGLSIIDNIKVRNFKYKQYNEGSPVSADDTIDMSEFPKADGVEQVLIGQGKTETQIGIIAQELETVAPNCVTTSERGIKTVDTDELFWHMLNAIKELSAKVTALEAA